MCYETTSSKSTRGEAIKELTQLIAAATTEVLEPATIVRKAVTAVVGDVKSEFTRIYNDKRVDGFRVKVTVKRDTEIEGRDLYRIYKLVSAFFPLFKVKVEFVQRPDVAGPYSNDAPQLRVYFRSAI